MTQTLTLTPNTYVHNSNYPISPSRDSCIFKPHINRRYVRQDSFENICFDNPMVLQLYVDLPKEQSQLTYNNIHLTYPHAVYSLGTRLFTGSTILIDFKGHMETCCIDSGSDISLIDKALLQEVPSFKKVRVYPFDLSNIYSACGERLHFAGYFNTQAVVGKVPVNLKLYIAYNAQCRCILGNDFLQKYQVIINYQTHTLEISKQNQVTLHKGVVLPLNEDVEALGVLQQIPDDDSEFYALLKLRQQYKGVQLGPSHTITFVRSGKVPFVIQNRSHKSADIPAGEIIGSVTPIKADALVQPKGVHCVKEHIQVIDKVGTNTSLDSLQEVKTTSEGSHSMVDDASQSTESLANVINVSEEENPEADLDMLDGIVSLSDVNSSGYEADVSSAILSGDSAAEGELTAPLPPIPFRRNPALRQK